MRQSWTDERLDEFGKRIDERFDHVDDRFEEVDRRFREVNHRLDGIDARLATELPRLDQRLDDLHRVMLQGFLVLVGIQVTFFVSTIGFIAVQG